MEYKTIRCSSLLNTITKRDTLFIGTYTLDPYQNCEFKCCYCDSSTENTVYIKINAAQILEIELKKLQKNHKRKNDKGFIIIGSISDPYQEAEKEYGITKNLLETIRQHGFPCHILTKSTLILRDVDTLVEMKKAVVTISMISLDENISNIFEGKTPSPMERLKTVKKLSEKGIQAGIAVIPLLPYIVEDELKDIIEMAYRHKAHHLLHRCLELKGDQKKIFMETIEKTYPHLIDNYKKLYGDSYKPDRRYTLRLNKLINSYCEKHGIPTAIRNYV
ncbi:MAG: hypothetical protein DRN05_01030 [Thermoplasmata archaeon]|nr:MAG: hypothetical protein DRN05_01030 [Thermoplasmata archaeon]